MCVHKHSCIDCNNTIVYLTIVFYKFSIIIILICVNKSVLQVHFCRAHLFQDKKENFLDSNQGALWTNYTSQTNS